MFFILLAAKIRRYGFSTRIPFTNFIQRYSILAYPITMDLPLTRETCENILHKLKMQNWTTGLYLFFLIKSSVTYSELWRCIHISLWRCRISRGGHSTHTREMRSSITGDVSSPVRDAGASPNFGICDTAVNYYFCF